MEAGADVLVPDYRDGEALLECLLDAPATTGLAGGMA